MPSGKAVDTDAFVADASVGIAWSVASQASVSASKLLDRIGAGAIFVVPVLWPFEVTNALLVLVRRSRLAPGDFARARAELSTLIPLIDDVGPRVAWIETADLAEKFGLTIYDASYLELAMRRGLPLASRDASLNDAARRSGIRTLL